MVGSTNERLLSDEIVRREIDDQLPARILAALRKHCGVLADLDPRNSRVGGALFVDLKGERSGGEPDLVIRCSRGYGRIARYARAEVGVRRWVRDEVAACGVSYRAAIRAV